MAPCFAFSIGPDELTIVYPWTSLPKDTIINDVGGNNGHTMLELIKAYPDLKVVVQDLEIIRPRFEEVSILDLGSDILC